MAYPHSAIVVSATLWFKELSKFLTSIGFVPNPYDPCVMNAGSGDQQITIGVYVDDIIITCKSESRVTNTIQLLEPVALARDCGDNRPINPYICIPQEPIPNVQ